MITKKKFITAKKRRKSRKLFITATILILTLGFVFIGLIYTIVYSDLFIVKTFMLNSSSSASENYLLSLAISNIAAKSSWKAWFGFKNIIFWQFEKELLVSNLAPQLKKMTVTANFLRKEVVLNTEERQLFGLLCLSAGDCYGFDKEGVAFMKAPDVQGYLFLKFIDINERNVVLGSAVFENSKQLQQMVSVVDSVKKVGFYIKEILIKEKTLEEWEIKISNGPVLVFSFQFIPTNIQQILLGLVDKIQLKDMTQIDFRVPNKVYYK